MRTRRLLTALTVAAVIPLLTGCGVVGLLQTPTRAPAGPLEAGACLEGMVGNDSDRDSVVDCDSPHRFEVVAIEEWDGMEDFIADDPDHAWSKLHPTGESAARVIADYSEWSSSVCQQAAMEAAGIDGVEVDGHTAADLLLRLGGGYGIDISLASRAAFEAGDHRTVCSAAWYNEYGAPSSIQFPDGVRFADVNTTSLPLTQRECWSDDLDVISCEEQHAAQVIVDFDGLEAFGPEVVARTAEGEATDDDWDLADDFCDQLTDASMARPDFMYGLSYLAETQSDYGWGSWDGEIDPELTYRYACLIVSPNYGGELTGDVFAGTAESVGGTPYDEGTEPDTQQNA